MLPIPVLFALPWVSLPGVDVEAVRARLGEMGMPVPLRPPATTGVFALGLAPLVYAAIVVGLALLAVPRWRPLVEHARGRRRLRFITLGLTVVLALAQAFGISTLLQNFGDLYSGSTAVTVLTLTAGTMLLVGAADLLSRHGLGNGFSLLLGYALVGGEIESFAARVLADRDGLPGPGMLALLVAAPAAAVYALGRVLVATGRARAPIPAEEEGPSTYRHHAAATGAAHHAAAVPFVRLPASGVGPLAAGALVFGTMSLPLWRMLDVPSPAFLLQRSAAAIPVQAGLVFVVALLLALGLHPAERVARLFRRAGDAGEHDAAVKAAREPLRRAALRSAALLGVVAAVAALAGQALPWFPAATSLFVVAAVGLDLLTEWRARRAAGQLETVSIEHDVDAAEAALAALHEARITAHARGAHHRSLLQIFGSYVPIEILVPADRAGEASGVLAQLTAREAAGEAAPEAPAGDAPPAPRKRKRRRPRPAEA
ncbi:MAG: hypothetical protein QM820_01940 [Minicystis sp.]